VRQAPSAFSRHLECAPKQLNQILPEDKMCSVVSGESISIARKNKSALNITWEVPALLAGNHIPSYQDVGGRIARRFVVFNFNTLIKDKDTTLRSRILRDELPKIILNCLANYHVMRDKIGAGQLPSQNHAGNGKRDAHRDFSIVQFYCQW
jgi:phage/plasmid-associated DNA primase